MLRKFGIFLTALGFLAALPFVWVPFFMMLAQLKLDSEVGVMSHGFQFAFGSLLILPAVFLGAVLWKWGLKKAGEKQKISRVESALNWLALIFATLWFAGFFLLYLL